MTWLLREQVNGGARNSKGAGLIESYGRLNARSAACKADSVGSSKKQEEED